MKDKLRYLAGPLAVLAVIGVLAYGFTQVDHSKKHAALTPAVAGARFAAIYNRTPPLTQEIVRTGRCVANPKARDEFACLFSISDARMGGKACVIVAFKLDGAKARIGRTQAVSRNSYCP